MRVTLLALAWLSLAVATNAAQTPDIPTLADAEARFAEGRLREAESLFQALSERDPGDSRAATGWVRALAEQGRRIEAAGRATSLAAAAERAGDLDAASTLLELAVELDPAAGGSRAALGRVWATLDRHSSAVTQLRRAVALGHGDLETLFYLGSSLWETGDVQEARDVFTEALDLGRRPVVLAQLGRLLVWSGSHAEAIPVLEEALAAHPGDVGARIDLARALEGADQSERALEVYREVVAVAPEHAEIRYVLARLLRRAGDEEAARRELLVYERLYREEQERTRTAGLERAALDRGRDLLRRGEARAAVELLAGQPETPDLLALLGRAYLAAGKPDLATAALERAVAAAPQREDLRAQLRSVRLGSGGP